MYIVVRKSSTEEVPQTSNSETSTKLVQPKSKSTMTKEISKPKPKTKKEKPKNENNGLMGSFKFDVSNEGKSKH